MTYGKSYAVPMKLFQNWLVTNFNPLPDGEVQALMWNAWLESYLVMHKIIRPVKQPDVIVWEDVS